MKWCVIRVVGGIPISVWAFPEHKDAMNWLREKQAKKMPDVKGCYCGTGPLEKLWVKLVGVGS